MNNANDDEQKEHIENLTGGNIVAENVRAVYRAIRHGGNGFLESQILIQSLPIEEYSKLAPIVDRIKNKNMLLLTELERKTQPGAGKLGSERRKAMEDMRGLLQAQSLDITQQVIGYLNSIGQWWIQPKSTIEKGTMSLYDKDGDELE